MGASHHDSLTPIATGPLRGAAAFAALRNEPCVALAEHLSVLEVTGAGAQTFLQAQLTCDLRRIESDPSQPLHGAFCTAKGQVAGTFIVCRLAPQHYLLLTAATWANELVRRLGRFILRAKVALSVGRDWAVLGTANADFASHAPLAAAGISIKTSAGVGYQVVPRESIAEPLVSPMAPLTWIEPEAWHWFEIQRRWPWIVAATSESFLPQMLGLDAFEAVAFDKGCYPGQEIVARARYVGEVRRRLYAFEVAGELPPPPGTPVMRDAVEMGRVVDAARGPAGRVFVLAVVPTEAVERDAEGLQLGGAAAPLVIVAN